MTCQETAEKCFTQTISRFSWKAKVCQQELLIFWASVSISISAACAAELSSGRSSGGIEFDQYIFETIF